MSHHGLSHLFKRSGIVADNLTGIHSAIVKCLLVNRSCIHKGAKASPQVKLPEDSDVACSVEAMQ
jgi:hypothetical protein